MKKCNVCLVVKEDTEFHKKKLSSGKHSLKSLCKSCVSDKFKTKYKQQTEEDRLRRMVINKQWRANNRDTVLALKKKYRIASKIYRLSSVPHDHHVKAHESYNLKQSLIKHDQHVKEWRSDEARISRWQYRNNINEMLYSKLKRGIYRAMGNKATGTDWYGKLGYSIDELKVHIEKQFLVGMSWDNRDQWHIDHMIPICMFNIESVDSDEFKVCFAIQNLRPLWPKDNRDKYYKVERLLKNKRKEYLSNETRI